MDSRELERILVSHHSAESRHAPKCPHTLRMGSGQTRIDSSALSRNSRTVSEPLRRQSRTTPTLNMHSESGQNYSEARTTHARALRIAQDSGLSSTSLRITQNLLTLTHKHSKLCRIDRPRASSKCIHSSNRTQNALSITRHHSKVYQNPVMRTTPSELRIGTQCTTDERHECHHGETLACTLTPSTHEYSHNTPREHPHPERSKTGNDGHRETARRDA
jgi:hypothetical protein